MKIVQMDVVKEAANVIKQAGLEVAGTVEENAFTEYAEAVFNIIDGMVDYIELHSMEAHVLEVENLN